MGESTKISVHQRLDAPGFVVRVVADGNTRKFATVTEAEAVSLAEAIKEYVEVGLPIDALVADSGEPASGASK